MYNREFFVHDSKVILKNIKSKNSCMVSKRIYRMSQQDHPNFAQIDSSIGKYIKGAQRTVPVQPIVFEQMRKKCMSSYPMYENNLLEI